MVTYLASPRGNGSPEPSSWWTGAPGSPPDRGPEERAMFLGHYGAAFALQRSGAQSVARHALRRGPATRFCRATFLLLGWEQVRIDPTTPARGAAGVRALPDLAQPGGIARLGARPGRSCCTTPGPPATPAVTGRPRLLVAGAGRLALVPLDAHRPLSRPAPWGRRLNRRSASASGGNLPLTIAPLELPRARRSASRSTLIRRSRRHPRAARSPHRAGAAAPGPVRRPAWSGHRRRARPPSR